jgi:hypothetical protein
MGVDAFLLAGRQAAGRHGHFPALG